jgi:ribosome-associated translation inhibitor RaiA
MDSYNGSINDPVSLHKYLYANANPVMYSDPSGYDGELIGQITGIAVLGELNNIIVGAFVGLGMTLLSELLTSTTLYEARNELEASIIVIGTQLNCKFSEIYRDLTIQNVLKTASLTADIDDIFISIKDYVKSRIDELKKNYNGSYQLHHIVAKNDYRAIASRAVIALYGIGIDSDENTILLRTEVHKVLHTPVYHAWVTLNICTPYVYFTTNDDNNDYLACIYVHAALLRLKTSLSILNTLL